MEESDLGTTNRIKNMETDTKKSTEKEVISDSIYATF